MEKHMDFEKKMYEVHKPNRFNYQADQRLSGCKITSEWTIVYPQSAGIVIKNAAKDLQDYFLVSMNISLTLICGENATEKSIFIHEDTSLEERSFSIDVSDRIIITGTDERYTAQGCFNLEDELNLNEAPVIEVGTIKRKMRFSYRSICSGMDRCAYPDEHLNMIAHSGMTAIGLKIGGILEDTKVLERTIDIVERASHYGLDVYCFPPFKNTVHPEEEGAFEHYDNMYGKVFELCPKLKGFIIVGECCEFPSKDERTTGKSWRESLDDVRPSPGWFPCRDYPRFISLLRDVIKSHSKTAELVFWTYNWGFEEQSLREELLRNVPDDITMMATFEMFEKINVAPEIEEITTDYTLWQIGPGKYFTTESEIAKERNIKMYAMTNTAGNTWDIGGIPYIPAPQRWIERWQAVCNAQDTLRLDGVRESHNYGYWPSFITEMAKYAYMVPQVDLGELLERIIIRDYGRENLADVLKAYELFSEGMSHCVSTNEDQYGPARVGPSYPLFFKYWELIPPCPVSGRAVNYEAYPIYTYNLDRTEKLLYETDEYEKMAALFAEGCEILSKIVDTVEEPKKKTVQHVLEVASYIRNNAITVCHVKKWHYLKGQLGVYVDAAPTWVGGRKHMEDAKKAIKPLIPVSDTTPVVKKLIEILKAEIENAQDTIPLLEANSRLGYNQEYGYSCTKEQIEWKIKMAENTLKEELLPLLA